MNEKLLHFIWKFKLFQTTDLQTTDGLPIQIMHVGTHNQNAGPDFLEAKIKIGETLWVGNIELHLKTNDWEKHKHQHDKKYSNTILHVVYEHNASTPDLHTLELKSRIDKYLLARYSALMDAETKIPCISSLKSVKELVIEQQKEKVLIERLMSKSAYMKELLSKNNNHWQEVFYISLARAFGIHINQDCFETVAKSLPLTILSKHKSNLHQLEALLFGQAGLLNDYFYEDYPQKLQREYEYLGKLYQLKSMDKHLWKFLRLRPANFPTIRLAQFAMVLYQSSHLFSKLLETENLKDIEKLFKVGTSEYWTTHYVFNEATDAKEKSIGKSFVHAIIINVLSPLLFVYGKHQGKEHFCERAFQLLRELKPEKNALIAAWQNTLLQPQNAAESQALIELSKSYCHHKRCLECSIGYSLLRS